MTSKTTLALLLSLCAPAVTHAAVYASNANTGFGGVLNSLEITDNGIWLDIELTAGADLNDAFVMYFSTGGPGPSSTANFTDTDDPLRQAISGSDGTNRSVVNVPNDFQITHALALNATFAGIWETVENGSHNFVSTAALPGGSQASPYSMAVQFSDLGVGPGDSFEFVGTYLNSSNAFRSDEAFGDGIDPPNPGLRPVTFTGARSYTIVPEPAVALLGGFGLLALPLSRRRDPRRSGIRAA